MLAQVAAPAELILRLRVYLSSSASRLTASWLVILSSMLISRLSLSVAGVGGADSLTACVVVGVLTAVLSEHFRLKSVDERSLRTTLPDLRRIMERYEDVDSEELYDAIGTAFWDSVVPRARQARLRRHPAHIIIPAATHEEDLLRFLNQLRIGTHHD